MDKNNIIISNIPVDTPPTVQQKGEKNVNVTNLPGGNINIINGSLAEYDDSGKPYTPIQPVRLDSQRHIIYLGNDTINIPVEMIPLNPDDTEQLPYINALCEVYAEKLMKEIVDVTPSTISSLPKNIQKHYSSQKKAYYAADYVQHVARETFVDGEQQLLTLKDDAYEGIETTLLDDYPSGYDRLKAVLEKITSTTLSKSALINVTGLIGNLEKKGICHILVNDEVITSWVNTADE